MKKHISIEKRKTFRHGDMRNALLTAGLAMARAGGPEAVVLREATRQAGVAATADFFAKLCDGRAEHVAALLNRHEGLFSFNHFRGF